ncbi:MAG: hypothetical protein NXH95_15190 [Pseudomonadaceae bacterium]|nr:hypothetical protein [Pseudomonadaceae bacterium]
MHRLIQITSLAALVLGTCTAYAAPYDGRGSADCEDLAFNVRIAKESFDDYRRHASRMAAQQRQYEKIHQPLSTSEWEMANSVVKDHFQSQNDDRLAELRSELEDAQMAYDMNGCTRGGSTTYNHNY